MEIKRKTVLEMKYYIRSQNKKVGEWITYIIV